MKRTIIVLSILIALFAFTTSASAVGELFAEITHPSESEIVEGLVYLEAEFIDNDDVMNAVFWAVRSGTCAASTNTVAGNVDGFSDSFAWDGSLFSATIDTTGWTPGEYCFVFNPSPTGDDVRPTRWFIVDPQEVYGGGQILEGDKKTEEYKISFGGWVNELEKVNGDDLIGEWQINFHNVGVDGLDKSKFHTTNITVLNLYPGNSGTCNDAMNFTALGTLNGEPGYKIIFRAGDLGSPGKADTIRIEIIGPSGKVYDTHWDSEFTDESSCVGTARTGLDNGNITIVND